MSHAQLVELLWAAYFCGIIALIVGYFNLDLTTGDKKVYKRILIIWPLLALVLLACKLYDMGLTLTKPQNKNLNEESRMKIIMRTFFCCLAIAALLIFSAPSIAKQGGVKLPETQNSRLDAWFIHQDVVTRFTYEEDAAGEDNWDTYDGNFPFVGDCEDFAFTMQKMIGAGAVYAAYLPDENYKEGELNRPNHAVFVYAGMVWELNGDALTVGRYEQHGRAIYFRFGDLTSELR